MVYHRINYRSVSFNNKIKLETTDFIILNLVAIECNGTFLILYSTDICKIFMYFDTI